MSGSTISAPTIPVCKLAEYMTAASATRRRSLLRAQIKQALEVQDKKRWWHNEAKAEIRKWIRVPDGTRQDLLRAANRLRDQAASEDRKSKQDNLRASARALEAFAPVAELVRLKGVVPSAGRRDGAHLHRAGVKIVVAPDLLFLEPVSEHTIGALKLHSVQEHKLSSDALLSTACILFAYLKENGDVPKRDRCVAVDLFTPAFETAPAQMKQRMKAVEAACEEIEASWQPMVVRLREELAARRRRPDAGN
jgi:hypothetical protein